MARKEKIETARDGIGILGASALAALLGAIAIAAGFLGVEAYQQRFEIRELRAEIERARKGADDMLGTYIDKVRDFQKADIRHEVEAFGANIRGEIGKLSEGAASKSDVAEVAKRLDEVASAKGADFVLLSASAVLRDKVAGGAPFKAELELVSDVFGKRHETEEHIKALRAIASPSHGVKTTVQLAQEFDSIADEVVFAANNPTGKKPNFAQRLWLRAKGLVKIRKLAPEGDAPDAVVARVEARLVAGDAKGAEEEFEKLRNAYPGAFAAGEKWSGSLRVKRIADESAGAIYGFALSKAAGAGKTK